MAKKASGCTDHPCQPEKVPPSEIGLNQGPSVCLLQFGTAILLEQVLKYQEIDKVLETHLRPYMRLRSTSHSKVHP